MGHGTASLSSQVNALLDGKLMIPSIQRSYVWRRPLVPELLDSLYRGYPVGSLLIWSTGLDVPLRPAAVVQGVPTWEHPALLLDGQQRLTTLAKIVRPAAVTIGTELDVRFDLRDERFLNPSAVQRKDPALVPVTEVLQGAPDYFGILARAGAPHTDPNFQLYYERLQKLRRILDYQIPILTVESDDYEEVADIFARVNRGGRRLAKGELVYSAVAARWPEGLDVIESFQKKLHKQHFALNREAVLRLMGILAGVGPQAIRLIDKKISGEMLKVAWAKTETALGWVVDFIQGDCEIPRSAALTSPNLVVIPAYLLHLRGNKLTHDESVGLRRWVYTAMAFSHYSSQVETKLEAEARVASTESGQRLVEELVRRASGPRAVGSSLTPADLERRGPTSPFFTLLYIAALRAGAKDWHTNVAVTALPMTSTSKIEYHHVFPKALVSRRYGPELVNSVANLAFIAGKTNREIGRQRPSEYLATIHPERLVEQWVPGAETWELDRFEEFLGRRRQAQVAVLNDMLGLPPHQGDPGTASELVDDEDIPNEDEADVVELVDDEDQ